MVAPMSLALRTTASIPLAHRAREQNEGEFLFEQIRLKGPADQIVDQVRQLIADGRLRAGQQLPTEREMAGMLGVGRQAVRGALSKLARIGLVDVIPSRGAFVRSLTPEGVREPLLTFLDSEVTNMFKFMEVRRLLEAWCAEEAARGADRRQLDRIRNSLTLMEHAIHNDLSVSEADLEFHTAVAAAAGNVVIEHLLDSFVTLLHSTERFRNIAAVTSNLPAYLAEHRAIYEAIKARDVKRARNRMRAHIDAVSARVADVLKRTECTVVPYREGDVRAKRDRRAHVVAP
jgi:GntR family transcriptional regulator, transcriptional repressor for pyruvate dehydrogenase complex